MPLDQKPAKEAKVKKEAKQSLPSPSISSSSPQPSREESSRPKRSKKNPPSNAEDLQARKLKSYTQYANKSPFPNFAHPTPSESHLALRILSTLHGARPRPTAPPIASPTSAGCGASPSVLDALIRTILSQNTSGANSTRAKLSMDAVYGRSDDWAAIVQGGPAKLESAIHCGGLAAVKSKVILRILEQAHAKYGVYSLDHLHAATTEDAYTELLAFQGVGPKTASCVLLFCLARESFAVDTHVWRIAGMLGWVPKGTGREATQAHLDVRVPDEDKYGLHVLMITHGKKCAECRAGGKSLGKCELRRAFAKGREKKEEEEEEEIKDEVEKIKEEKGEIKDEVEKIKEEKKGEIKDKQEEDDD